MKSEVLGSEDGEVLVFSTEPLWGEWETDHSQELKTSLLPGFSHQIHCEMKKG